MAEQDGRVGGGYRGTVALNVAVPGRRRELVLTGVDVWDHCIELRGAATVDREDPFWLPSSWRITTDEGTVHTRGGGGGGSMCWHVPFEPRISSTTGELRIFVGPDDQRPPTDASLPDEPSVVVALHGWPAAVQRVPTRLDATRDLTPAIGRSPSLEGQRASRTA